MKLLFIDKLDKNNALLLFKKKIKEDSRFINDINDNLLTIEEKYQVYVYYEGYLHNHSYFIKNDISSKSINGNIDLMTNYISPLFLLNGLSKNMEYNEIEDLLEPIYNKKELDSDFNNFITIVKDKLIQDVCNKHNIKPSKGIFVDVAPIEGFHSLDEILYFERIYEFHYRDKSRKKDYVSILSSVTNNFFKLEFVYNEKYTTYLKYFKRPISYIPKEYIEYYYIQGFDTYLHMKNKLNYSKEIEIYKQVKGNISHLEYKKYKDYLYTGIFYFKIKSYLSRLSIDNEDIKKKIYLSYLTLKYNKESGLFLYECSLLNLLPDNSIPTRLRFLRISYSLGSLDAKTCLYRHYCKPIYYDEKAINKYS